MADQLIISKSRGVGDSPRRGLQQQKCVPHFFFVAALGVSASPVLESDGRSSEASSSRDPVYSFGVPATAIPLSSSTMAAAAPLSSSVVTAYRQKLGSVTFLVPGVLSSLGCLAGVIMSILPESASQSRVRLPSFSIPRRRMPKSWAVWLATPFF